MKKMNLLLAACVVAASALCVQADPAEIYTVTDARALTNLAQSVPTDEKNVSITLVLPEAHAANVALVTTLVMRDGKWAEKNTAGTSGLFTPVQTGSGPPAPPQRGEVTDVQLVLDDAGMRGTFTLNLLPLKWPNPTQGREVYKPASYKVSVDLKRTGKNVPLRDPDPTTPVWRKNNARPAGKELLGTFTAVRESDKAETTGDAAQGGINIVTADAKFGTSGNATIERATGDAMKLTVSMGEKRANSSVAHAFATKNFESLQDLSGYDGVRVTLSSEKRLNNVTLSLGLQERRGAWYGTQNAGFMTGGEATFIVPFSMFKPEGGYDDDVWLDLKEVKAMRVGVENPFGIGEQAITIKSIEAVKIAGVAKPDLTKPVTVTFKPNVRIAHEGDGVVPKGMFGFHDVNPPTKATGDDAKKILDYTRQLNPGFLRDITHTGVEAKPITDDEVKAIIAKREENYKANANAEKSFRVLRHEAADTVDNYMVAPTTNLWARPPWMNHYVNGTMPQFLDGLHNFYRRWAASETWMPTDPSKPIRLVEVWNEPFMWARHLNKHEPKLQDPTQFSSTPAHLVADVYSDIYIAAAKGVKSVNPHVKVGGPCSSAFDDDYFANTTNFVGRFIDKAHEHIDFIAEHHYQGYPATFAAGYDIITAYADSRVGKRFPIYNTETNDLIDTPNKGDAKEDQPFDANSDQLNLAYYNAKDIITMLREIPDIAKGRAVHALWSGFCRNPGETHVFTLLNNLRGEVVHSEASEPGFITFATKNGKDTVVFVMNDTPHERDVWVVAPGGSRATGAELQTLTYAEGTKLETREFKTNERVRLHKRAMIKVTFKGMDWFDGSAPTEQRIDHRRFYADKVFNRVEPGKPVTLNVKVPADAFKAATSARLRIVTRDVQTQEAAVEVGGQTVALPASAANEGTCIIQYVPLDLKLISGAAKLTFKTNENASYNGFDLHAASIVLTTEKNAAE